MNIKKLITFMAVALSVSACASVTRGTKEVLIIETTPQGAQAALSNGEVCQTPCSLKLKRKYGVHASLTKDGYHTVEADINAETAGGGAAGMAGNLLAGGLIGAVVDSGNGSMNKFTPNPLQVTLEPLEEGEVSQVPVVDKGESFYFNSYVESQEKLPFDKTERKKLEKEVKKAAAKEKKEKLKAEKAAKKAARKAEKEAKRAAKAAKKAAREIEKETKK